MKKIGLISLLSITLGLISACNHGDTRSSGSEVESQTEKRALIVVDVQNCFTKGGSLAVDGGDDVIPYINTLIDSKKYGNVVLSQDWHPANHLSFANNHPNKKVYEVIKLDGVDQTLWPSHCVQNTKSAEFHPALHADQADFIVQKGTMTQYDSYSAFQDNNGRNPTELHNYLTKKDVKIVDIVGLALDYCVKATAIDARNNGYTVNLHLKGTKAVNVNDTDGQQAIEEMKKLGINIIE